MKITIITRASDFDSGIDVYAGSTREEAITKAVNNMREWYYDYMSEDSELRSDASDETIFRVYTEFWTPEEKWTIHDEEIEAIPKSMKLKK